MDEDCDNITSYYEKTTFREKLLLFIRINMSGEFFVSINQKNN